MNILPLEDGDTHINIYSKGYTMLGRMLSNFAHTPFIHPEDGPFASVEGYWYWLGCKNDSLRTVSGFAAKKLGRQLGASDWQDTEEFKRKIKLAIKAKLDQNPQILKDLKASELPLTHYYFYGTKVVAVPEGDWIIEYINEFR